MLQYIQSIQNIIDAIDKTRKITPSKSSQSLSVFISHDFALVKLEIEDTEELMTHHLLLKPNESSLAQKFDVVKTSLPHGVTFNPANSLQEYAEELINHINRLSYFINGFSFIDMYTCVVEPILKSSQDTFRIFRYDNKIYIRISFDPTGVNHDDITLQFIGPRELTSEVQEKYNKNRQNWDPEAGLFFNLKKILEVQDFPEQTEGMASEIDCAICMTYRDEEERAPIFCCNNLLCDINFHHSCVLKWWAMQKVANSYHGVEKGLCPNCKTFFELNKNG